MCVFFTLNLEISHVMYYSLFPNLTVYINILTMDNGSSIEPLTVPAVSNPPPLPPRRNLSPMPPPLPPRRLPGDLTVTDASLVLSKIEDAEEKGLDEKQLRELYDNEEIDRFLTLFSDVCNTSRASK